VQDPRLGVYRDVVTAARRVNAAVYFLDARGLTAAQTGMDVEIGTRTEFRDLGSWFTEQRERGEGSQALAADTGGFSLSDTNDLAAGLARIGREARSFYLLGYAPSNRAADGRFRRIEVNVAREGVTVRARRGYFAPGGARRAKPEEGRDAAMQRALDAPFDLPDVPLRAIADVGPSPEPGKATVRLLVEAEVRGFAFVEKGGLHRDTLDLLVLVTRQETGDFTRFDQQVEMSLKAETRARYETDGFPIAREMPLSPGRYQARVVARDRNGGRLGSVLHEFEVPPLDGLRVSTVSLTDRAASAEAASPPGGLEPTARRRFAPAGVLHCRFEVYGAAKDATSRRANVMAGFSIRRADGRILVAMPETPLQPAADGLLSRRLGIPIDGAPPGTYEAIAVVTDLVAGRSAESREPFAIEGPRP